MHSMHARLVLLPVRSFGRSTATVPCFGTTHTCLECVTKKSVFVFMKLCVNVNVWYHVFETKRRKNIPVNTVGWFVENPVHAVALLCLCLIGRKKGCLLYTSPSPRDRG